MSDFREATICLNGHVLSTSSSNYQPKCDKCGVDTISECPSCLTKIQGSLIYPSNFIGFHSFDFPNYCFICGLPFPWTTLILENAVELLSLDENVDDSVKEVIKSAIPGLLVDSPTTPLSVAKFQKNLPKFSDPIKNALYQLLVDVVSETVKKSLFPDS